MKMKRELHKQNGSMEHNLSTLFKGPSTVSATMEARKHYIEPQVFLFFSFTSFIVMQKCTKTANANKGIYIQRIKFTVTVMDKNINYSIYYCKYEKVTTQHDNYVIHILLSYDGT